LKVAIFSDVHANLIALETFAQLTKLTVDAYVCLGDIVNYGPWNDECLELIWNLPNVQIIEGNHERLFAGRDSVTNILPLVKEFYGYSYASFSRKDLLENLVPHIFLESYKCQHTIDNLSVYPDTDIDISLSHIIGHTHYQFQIPRTGFEIINPGSIGQNRQWINVIDYIIFDSDCAEMDFKSAPYDVDRFINELRSRKYSENCINYYLNKPRLSY